MREEPRSGAWTELSDGSLLLDGGDGWRRRVRVVPVSAAEGTSTVRNSGGGLIAAVTEVCKKADLAEGDRVKIVMWEAFE